MNVKLLRRFFFVVEWFQGKVWIVDLVCYSFSSFTVSFLLVGVLILLIDRLLI